MTRIPCAIFRGGTSKGVFILEEHLPAEPVRRDAALIALMGSPDPRQIDGLGGADPLTSKVVIVGRSARPGCDLEYESLEVAIGESFVNHGIMCGNLTAGVGAFAMLEGLLPVSAATRDVRLFCRNNGKTIVHRPRASAPGEPTTVSLMFEEPAGAVTGKLLPTGEPLSSIEMEGGLRINASVVDAGTLYAFVRAREFGVSGHESAADLDANVQFRGSIEQARERIVQLINTRLASPTPLSSRRLKVALVAAPEVAAVEATLAARVINPAKVHKAYAVSGAISLGAAATIRGTVAHEIVGAERAPFTLRIAHPTGVLPVVIHYTHSSAGHLIQGAEVERSIRLLMRGEAHLPTARI